jgi:LacI family transcriptional regulator
LEYNAGNKKITIKDIANHADVSIGTVDRVLHNRGEVKEETRQKIMDIVNKFGYTPNVLAKSLASRKTHKISVLIPDASDNNPYWDMPLSGIQQAAGEINDYNTIIETYTFNATNERSFNKIIHEVISAKPDGVIFNPVFRESSLDFMELLDAHQIPYIFIDINLENGHNLSYFGQDAKQSGYVAGKIICRALPDGGSILIVKLANHKVITRHLRLREEGFNNYISKKQPVNKYQIISTEIDLLESDEPDSTLQNIFEQHRNIKGVFVPNSRVFKVASFLENLNNKDLLLVGFDLIDENLKYLENDTIDFLIGQKPEEQGFKSVMAMFSHLISHKEIPEENHSPIDIIIKENLKYYINTKRNDRIKFQ